MFVVVVVVLVIMVVIQGYEQEHASVARGGGNTEVEAMREWSERWGMMEGEEVGGFYRTWVYATRTKKQPWKRSGSSIVAAVERWGGSESSSCRNIGVAVTQQH